MDTQRVLSDFSVYVVGAGAIGRVMAGMLSQQGYDPTIVCRHETSKEIKANGGYTFVTHGNVETSLSPKLMSFDRLSEHKAPKTPLIFYATKATYLPQTVKHIQPIITPESHHVFLQGGIPWWLGHAVHSEFDLKQITDANDSMIKAFGTLDNIYAGMIKFGAVLDGNKAELKGKSDITFGAVVKNPENISFCHALKDMFDQELVKPYVFEGNLAEAIWTKAAGSFAMSAYALISGNTLGQMYDDVEIRQSMITCAEHVFQAGQALGIVQSNEPDWDAYFAGIAKSKPDHRMSITKDSSEIAQIIGWPAAIARKVNAISGLLQDVYEQIPKRYKPRAGINDLPSNAASLDKGPS